MLLFIMQPDTQSFVSVTPLIVLWSLFVLNLCTEIALFSVIFKYSHETTACAPRSLSELTAKGKAAFSCPLKCHCSANGNDQQVLSSSKRLSAHKPADYKQHLTQGAGGKGPFPFSDPRAAERREAAEIRAVSSPKQPLEQWALGLQFLPWLPVLCR